MLVTPGPGIVTILVGLAILGIEYNWARRLHTHIRDRAVDASGKVLPAKWQHYIEKSQKDAATD